MLRRHPRISSGVQSDIFAQWRYIAANAALLPVTKITPCNNYILVTLSCFAFLSFRKQILDLIYHLRARGREKIIHFAAHTHE